MSDERIARIKAYRNEHGCTLHAAVVGVERQDARRGRQCAAALAGIDDPAAFIQDVRDLLAAWNEGDDLQAAIDAVSRHLPESK